MRYFLGLLALSIIFSFSASAQTYHHLAEVGLALTAPGAWEKQQGETKESDSEFQFGFVYLAELDVDENKFNDLFVTRHDYFDEDRLEAWNEGKTDPNIGVGYSLVDEPIVLIDLPFDGWQAFLYDVDRGEEYPGSRRIIVYATLGNQAYKIVVGGIEDTFASQLDDYLDILHSIKIIDA